MSSRANYRQGRSNNRSGHHDHKDRSVDLNGSVAQIWGKWSKKRTNIFAVLAILIPVLYGLFVLVAAGASIPATASEGFSYTNYLILWTWFAAVVLAGIGFSGLVWFRKKCLISDHSMRKWSSLQKYTIAYLGLLFLFPWAVYVIGAAPVAFVFGLLASAIAICYLFYGYCGIALWNAALIAISTLLTILLTIAALYSIGK